MRDHGVGGPTRIHQEIEQGLQKALQAHYADAATHFMVARDECSPLHVELKTALAALLDSHTRFWQAQQALHQASQRFAAADNEQQERLAALQAMLAHAAGAGPIPKESAIPAAPRTERPRATPRDALPALYATCFGHFAVLRKGSPIELCRNRNGQAIFRYLIAHPQHRQTMDALMEALWPNDTPEAARHKLHVATSALRCALNGELCGSKGAGYLLCESGSYALNPAIPMATDVDDFVASYQAGQQAGGRAAVSHYEQACGLYTGPFLIEDLYSDWSLIRREQLAQMYLSMCRALTAHYLALGHYHEVSARATMILSENRCDEVAYRQLIRAYTAEGRRADALRQYQRCERVLAEELGVQPADATRALFYALVRGEVLPPETGEHDG